MIQFGGEMFRRDNDDIWGMVIDVAADPSTDMALDRRTGAALDEIERLQDMISRQQIELRELADLKDCREQLRRLGRIPGCDHVESPDDRSLQVHHIEEAFEKLQDENRELRALLQNPCWQIVT